MNLETATQALAVYLDADIPAFLWGAPGIGKSDVVRQIARERGWSLIDFRAALRDPVALMGVPQTDSGFTRWAPPDELPRAERDGPEGILFLDELNAAAPQVQTACFGLVLDRKVGEYDMRKVAPGWRIVAAGNRQSDRAAAQRMPSALANRFAHIEVEPCVNAWKTWANRVGLAPVVVAFFGLRPALLHMMPGQTPEDRTLPAVPADAKAFPTMRAWEKVARILDKAPDPLRQSLVAGLVGEGPAAELEGFIRVWRSLPPIQTILADPTGAAVPYEPAALYAVSTALSRVATRANVSACFAYGRRLPKEFSVMLALDAVRRDPSLKETSAFAQWAIDNRDVTL